MKYSLFLSLLICSIACADMPKQDYRFEKAHDAIIYDNYIQAQPYTKHLPPAYLEMLQKFNINPEDVRFYTATRMDRFVEKVGNNIILLFPNFFLYLTEEEQAAEIATQLGYISRNENPEVEQKNLKLLNKFKKYSLLAAGGFLALAYAQEIKAHASEIKTVLTSKAALIIGSCLAANFIADQWYEYSENQTARKNQFEVLNIIGSENWIATKEKQVQWGKINSGILYNWYYLLGKLGLAYMPEVELQKYQEHIDAQQAN